MGHKHSEETKQKMSEAAKRREKKPKSEQMRKKLSETRKRMPGRPHSEETKKKMSEVRKGKTKSMEHRIKMSISQGGNGKFNKPLDIRNWRARNIERTPYCQFCFSEDNLHAHHIIQKAKFPQYQDEDWNCRMLCEDCHRTCHKQGGY